MNFFVSTYTEGFFNEGANGSKGIYLCNFDELKNEINVLDSFDTSINPSFIKLSDDKKYLFVACEKLPPSRLDVYKFIDNKLKLNDSVNLDFRSCCYISYNDKNNFVAVANYGSGEIFTYNLDSDNKFKNIVSINRNENNEIGPNSDRQELPHAHSIRLIKNKDLYVACDLGCDKITLYTYSKQASLNKYQEIKTPATYGPRHTTNTKDGNYLYVTCELENRILFYEYINGKYVLKQDSSSIAEDFKGINTCADIHISSDEKYIFVSNRGANTIVQFEILENGYLLKIQEVSCNGNGPRNFAITDNYLICANQDSNDCSILEIQDGLLTGKVLCKKDFISPVCIEKI